MGYCYRCWTLKGEKTETSIIWTEGKGWGEEGEGGYYCLHCLNEMERLEKSGSWFVALILPFLFLLFFFAWGFLCYKAGEQTGERKEKKRIIKEIRETGSVAYRESELL